MCVQLGNEIGIFAMFPCVVAGSLAVCFSDDGHGCAVSSVMRMLPASLTLDLQT